MLLTVLENVVKDTSLELAQELWVKALPTSLLSQTQPPCTCYRDIIITRAYLSQG